MVPPSMDALRKRKDFFKSFLREAIHLELYDGKLVSIIPDARRAAREGVLDNQAQALPVAHGDEFAPDLAGLLQQ